MKSVKTIGLALAIIIVLALTIIQHNLTRAEKYPSILSTVEANVPEVEVPTVEAQAARQSQANIAEVEKMVGAWQAKKIKYGQWMHTVDKMTSEEDRGVVLPDGQPMPLSYIGDDWFYVNKDGRVEKGVFTMKDANDKILQQAAYRNNLNINFTFDLRQEYPPSALQLDYGYMSQVNDARKSGFEIRKSEENRKGKPSVVFFYTEVFKKPVVLGNQKTPVKSITVKAYFDKANGDFTQSETTYILENGKKVLYEMAEYLSIEIVPQAPAEILAILEKVK